MTINRNTLLVGIATLFLTIMSATASGTMQEEEYSTRQVVADSSATEPDSTATTIQEIANPNYIDEVVWVVGDEAILRSDIEMMRLQAEQEGVTWDGNPDCRIPEQIAVQKLFLNQAAIDSIEVTEAEIAQGIEQQINYWIQLIGSREKLEEYRKMTISQMRESLHDDFKNQELTRRMRAKLIEDVKVTPAEVREYFRKMPEDSIPFIPTTVEVQIITNQPRIPVEEINKIKDELRDFTNRIQSGNTTFATLARLYSEDGSARQGGEIGFYGRGHLDPAFAQVAFNLTDPKKVSKIVESEFGFHIIQLIEKRGDKINCRHILRKPKVPQTVLDETLVRMDSIGDDLRNNIFTFEEGATFISDDKETKNNKGLMSNVMDDGFTRTSRFEMKDLPTEIARVVDTLQVGQVSKAFTMVNSKGKTVCAIIKLKSRTEGHKANIMEDFQVMSNVVLEKMQAKKVKDWVQKKIKDTYVRVGERYRDCDFEYEGWIR